jgi:membrane protein insertase Oxa1/YidC/SpoIIIJ
VYWAANNTLSLVQAQIVKSKVVKDWLGIKELPKSDDDSTPNPFKKFADAMSEFNEQRKAEADGKVQFIGGDSEGSGNAPPPPPVGLKAAPAAASDASKAAAKTAAALLASGPPPVTYAANPKQHKKSSSKKTNKK